MGVKNVHHRDQILKRFHNLICRLQEASIQRNKNSNIMNTKFGYYYDLLNKYINENTSTLSDNDLLELFGLVTRFNELDYLFTKDCKIQYNTSDLIEIIEGEKNINDGSHNYNDKFYELSMAIRFAKGHDTSAKVDMKTICDVIIDNKVAIECKYLHSRSKNSVRANLKKSLEQVEKRINTGLASEGFSAINATNVCNKERIKSFANNTLKMYMESFENIHLSKKEIFDNCCSNRNMISSICSYATHEASVIIHESLDFFRNDKPVLFERFSNKVYAVVFQVNDCIWLEYEEFYAPVQIRGLEPVFNPQITNDEKSTVMYNLKKLAIGI
ncbi:MULTISPECIES: hypothetical protein [Citrobacter]|uniref:hypothetical protein n=1 Tax=Citrobacter TaxID=544 RepID=UPI000F517DA7|nr:MULTISPECIES: hypothetical protein [Citrobacter]MDM3329604.1 hypothetical protein [Citrobacter sp. Cb130]MEB2418206.1 hypothetical protein [Citrobacter sp. R-1.5.2]RPH24323.1 hypothetical protein EHN13_13555 [Citrobacter youngae]